MISDSDFQLSMKTLKNGASHQEILTYFQNTFTLYEKLFELIKYESSYYTKPDPLRHPLIFYYGHTASFFVNKLIDANIISERINPLFESIFAVGVDEMDWDDLNEENYDWPSVQQVTEYRNEVRKKVSQVIVKLNVEIKWESQMWLIMMGIQHERIHLQLSAVMIRRLPINQIKSSQIFLDCPYYKVNQHEAPKNQLLTIPPFEEKWSRQRHNTSTYGWDNQFGQKNIDLSEFKASKMLVSNAEYLEFVQDQGYSKLQFWDEEGRAWLKSLKYSMPLFWLKEGEEYFYRTMNKVMELPMNWPVEVNNLEASAFCEWKSAKENIKLRLPSESEYFALRNFIQEDQPDWKPKSVGNINLQHWCSPQPVDQFEKNNFYDIIGNVWELTTTPMHPLQEFQIHPMYEDFTTPTFDGKHFMIKGGSFISTGNQSLRNSRYCFRRHFHQFSGFRYVQSENKQEITTLMDQSDEKVIDSLKIHYADEDSYVLDLINLVKEKMQNPEGRSLVVGCSVGRAVLEFSKVFQESYGIDYSARFFHIATRILESDRFEMKGIEVKKDDLNYNRNKITLYQMNSENVDPKKINNFNIAVIDGNAIKKKTMKKVVNNIMPLMKKQSMILVVNSQENQISVEEFKKLKCGIQLVETKKSSIMEKELEFALYQL